MLDWAEVRLWLLRFAVKTELEKAGADGRVRIVSAELGSGYNKDKDIERAVEDLNSLCITLTMKYPHKILKNGTMETYCNFAARDAAHYFKCKDLDNKNANEQVQVLESLPPKWQKVDAKRAAAHAMIGKMGFACYDYKDEHGHIALIAPRPVTQTGSWSGWCPVVANVGKSNGIMGANWAFPVKKPEPLYFIYGADA